jgi:hypothetical protein
MNNETSIEHYMAGGKEALKKKKIENPLWILRVK